MRIFITSDTHFGHEAIKEYCGRPYNFEVLLWKQFNTLKAEDTLLHLGDICWYKEKEIHEQLQLLPCKKILVRGNHDKKSYSWYLNHGWGFVCERFDLIRAGKRIAFSHEPLAWDGCFDINVHGHLHNSQHRLENALLGIEKRGQYLVCIEDLKYRLLPLDKIISKLTTPQEEG